jgi:hypothetical protein
MSGAQILPAFRAQEDAHPQDAEGADLHQHAGVDHGHRRGCGHMPHRRPGVKGKHAGQDAEADVQQQKCQALLKWRKAVPLHQY